MLTDRPVRQTRILPEPVEALSAAFLESVLNASRDCIKVLTLEGELVFMNSGGLALMEVDDFETLRGCAWPSFWEGEHSELAVEALTGARAGLPGHFVGQANTAKGTPKWWDVTVSPILGDDGSPSHVLSISHDITVARELEMQRELLGGELIHRIKNVLAVVGAIANQSFRGGDPDQLDTFAARLSALGDAQSLLIEGALTTASINEVVARTLLPHAPKDRCSVTGAQHQLTAKRALALALAIHELATNATKYGAFSNEVGVVEIDWKVDDETLSWNWREIGGPLVIAPERTGFGSRIIVRNLASEFNGKVDLQHNAPGVVLTLTAPA